MLLLVMMGTVDIETSGHLPALRIDLSALFRRDLLAITAPSIGLLPISDICVGEVSFNLLVNSGLRG
jgi:hypothetical protein